MQINPEIDDPKLVYIRSEKKISIKALAEAYTGREGCSERHLQRRCTEEKWRDERKAFWSKTAQVTDEKLIDAHAEKAASKIEALNESAYKRIETLIKVNEEKLRAGIVSHSDGTTEIKLSPRDIRTISQTIIDLQGELRLCLNHHPSRPYEDKPWEQEPEKPEDGTDPILEALGASAATDWTSPEETDPESSEDDPKTT